MPKKRPESECGHSASRILSGAWGVLAPLTLRWKEAALRQALRQASQLPATASFSPPEHISVLVIRVLFFFKVLNFWKIKASKKSLFENLRKKFDLNLFQTQLLCYIRSSYDKTFSCASKLVVGVKDNCSRPVIWTLPYAPIVDPKSLYWGFTKLWPLIWRLVWPSKRKSKVFVPGVLQCLMLQCCECLS